MILSSSSCVLYIHQASCQQSTAHLTMFDGQVLSHQSQGKSYLIVFDSIEVARTFILRGLLAPPPNVEAVYYGNTISPIVCCLGLLDLLHNTQMDGLAFGASPTDATFHLVSRADLVSMIFQGSEAFDQTPQAAWWSPN